MPGDSGFKGVGPLEMELKQRFQQMPPNKQWDVVMKGMAGRMHC